MIINVSMSDNALIPIRLSFYNGGIYISLVDIIEASKMKDIDVLNDDDIKKVISIIGEDNFTSLYTENIPNLPVLMPYISQEGLKKLIDYPEIEDCLVKKNLSKIDDFITKNKKRITDIIFSNEYKLKIQKNIYNEKVVYSSMTHNDKMKEVNRHIKEIKNHLDIVLKLQEELIKGE